MPFGLTNAPASFQRLMETCMGDLYLTYCLLYLDDVIIYSRTYEEHMQRLEAVMQRIREAGLKLNASKCKFFQREIKYLGHIISEEGIAVDQEKIEAIRKWPVPTNVTEVQSFIGFAGFYRRFIEGFSKIARPLHDLTVGVKKGKVKHPPVFEWGQSQQAAFDELRKLCTEAPILAFAQYNLPFEVHTDASIEVRTESSGT